MRKTSLLLITGSVLLATLLSSCFIFPGGFGDDDDPDPTVAPIAAMQLTSAAFADGDMLPARHARRGENLSPPLAWSSAPDGTQSFALIVDDPDAPGGTWVHWIVYNLPADTTDLPEGITATTDLPGDAVQGKNSWKLAQYDGPQPPSGTHRYVFTLYALDTLLELEPGADKAALLSAMEGHILAQVELTGSYAA